MPGPSSRVGPFLPYNACCAIFIMKHRPDVSLLRNIHVIMVKTRFPENVGMAARACANMGVGHISLADPERWDVEKARPLGTAKARDLLDEARVFPTLEQALAPHHLVVGCTARTGGWRREPLPPDRAAEEMLAALREGGSVALVFGPEDRGLNNQEIESCQRLVTIPTAPGASSLNVAQAVLLILYECLKAASEDKGTAPRPRAAKPDAPRITAEEQARLYAALKDTLLHIDYLHGENPDYFLMPLRRFLGRAALRRHEYDAIMGVCRQVRNRTVPPHPDGGRQDA